MYKRDDKRCIYAARIITRVRTAQTKNAYFPFYLGGAFRSGRFVDPKYARQPLVQGKELNGRNKREKKSN